MPGARATPAAPRGSAAVASRASGQNGGREGGKPRSREKTGEAAEGNLLPPWARWQDADLMLALHVQPGARRSVVAGVHGTRLKIALQAPPVDGRANDALLRYVAERLAVRRADVVLRSGQTSREKILAVRCAPEDVGRILAALAPD